MINLNSSSDFDDYIKKFRELYKTEPHKMIQEFNSFIQNHTNIFIANTLYDLQIDLKKIIEILEDDRQKI